MANLKLTVRGKTYPVDVDSRGHFIVHLDEDAGMRPVMAESLKELEKRLTTATRVRTAKVAIQLKRLGRKPKKDYRQRYTYGGYYDDADQPWEVIVVTVRGINEHTGHLMVTWPDGTKGDDEAIGRYQSDRKIYFPLTMADEEILKRRRLIDETEEWFKRNAIDARQLAKREVAKALGEKSVEDND